MVWAVLPERHRGRFHAGLPAAEGDPIPLPGVTARKLTLSNLSSPHKISPDIA